MKNTSFCVLSLIPKKRFLAAKPNIPEWMSLLHWDDLDELSQSMPSGFQAVLGGGTPIPHEVLNTPGLEMVQLVSAGHDRVDMSFVANLGLLVCNNPGANAQAVAEHILMTLLYFARRAGEAQAIVYSGQFADGRFRIMGPQLRNLSEMTIGIVGLGAIGQRFAELVHPFGSKLLYSSRTRNIHVEAMLGLEYRELDELLQEADAIAVALPLTSQSYHLFDARGFALMKPTAIFINVGRGGVVDQQALVEALLTRQIYAAGLDVFEPEPIPSDHYLLHINNDIKNRLLLSPHTAGLTHFSWVNMVQNAIDNLVRYAIDHQPYHVITRLEQKGNIVTLKYS